MWMSAAHTVEVVVFLWAVSFSVGVHIRLVPSCCNLIWDFIFFFFPEDD